MNGIVMLKKLIQSGELIAALFKEHFVSKA